MFLGDFVCLKHFMGRKMRTKSGIKNRKQLKFSYLRLKGAEK